MVIGTVVGRATSTVKHHSLRGTKLLIVQPCLTDGITPDGDPVLAVDQIGSGQGDLVILTSDGRHAREVLKADATPVRWSVIGIQDPHHRRSLDKSSDTSASELA